MPRARTISQAQVNRVLKALKAEGLTAASIVVRADEVVRRRLTLRRLCPRIAQLIR